MIASSGKALTNHNVPACARQNRSRIERTALDGPWKLLLEVNRLKLLLEVNRLKLLLEVNRLKLLLEVNQLEPCSSPCSAE